MYKVFQCLDIRRKLNINIVAAVGPVKLVFYNDLKF